MQGKVALISGGGSGHEPLHGGFVGLGMLDAACPGEVFTSPVPDQMLAATKAVDGGAGVVHIVKNYTGDVMNFKLAAEDAADEGIDVESVLVDDDVAVQDSLYTAGRRGVGATVLAGEDRRRGGRARRRPRRGRRASRAASTSARARSASRCPRARRRRRASRSSTCPTGEMEVGVGIHGEPGRRREPLGTAQRDRRADGRGRPRATSRRPAARSVLPFVNGMGGTPQLELYLLYGEVERALRDAGLEPARRLVGSYITSLEMAGASLTLLELDDELDRAVGCSGPHRRAALGSVSAMTPRPSCATTTVTAWMTRGRGRRRATERDYLTQLDAAIGDGDHGINMTRGFEAVGKALAGQADDVPPGRAADPRGQDAGLHGRRRERARSGASALRARRAGRSATPRRFDGAALADALDAALAARRRPRRRRRRATRRWSTRSGPRPRRCASGVDAGGSLADAVAAAADAAEEGARATVPMQARKGRASYLGERSIGHQDPGATSAALIVRALERAVAAEG